MYGATARRLAREPVRSDPRRYAAFLLALGAVHLAVLLLAAALGVSYPAYVAEHLRLSGAYSVHMTMPFAWSDSAPQPVVALVLSALALAVGFGLRPLRDRISGSYIAGALPLVVAALIRSDTTHVWMGIMPLGAALIIVTVRQVERGRRAMPAAAGILLALLIFGWFGSHPDPIKAWMPTTFWKAVQVLRGKIVPDLRYDADVVRVLRWTEERSRSEKPGCIGLYGGADVIHALADLPGPTVMEMGWSDQDQRRLADRIRAQRCPYFVGRLWSFDVNPIWVSEDFLAIASLYRPLTRLGPAVFALALRETPMPEKAEPIGPTELCRRLSASGTIEIELGRQVPETHILRVAYTLDIPPWAGLLGAVPWLSVSFAQGEGTPFAARFMPLVGVNRRVQTLVPVNPWAAEWRWIAGLDPRRPRTTDQMLLSVQGALPPDATITIHSIEELAPGAPAATKPLDNFTESEPRDLIDEALRGRAFARHVSLERRAEGLAFWPNQDRHLPAEAFFPLQVGVSACLEGTVLPPTSAVSDGAGVDIDIIDVRDRQVKTILWTHELEALAAPIDFRLPLGAWAGEDVLLRVGTTPRQSSNYDWVFLEKLALRSCDDLLDVAGALRIGRAVPRHAKPSLQGNAILLLPNDSDQDPPASVVLPFEPKPGSCFATTLRLTATAGHGDGVWFEVSVADGNGEPQLLREHLDPGAPDRAPLPLPLGAWAHRRVELRLSTRPGPSAAYDWAFFLGPMIRSCN